MLTEKTFDTYIYNREVCIQTTIIYMKIDINSTLLSNIFSNNGINLHCHIDLIYFFHIKETKPIGKITKKQLKRKRYCDSVIIYKLDPLIYPYLRKDGYIFICRITRGNIYDRSIKGKTWLEMWNKIDYNDKKYIINKMIETGEKKFDYK